MLFLSLALVDKRPLVTEGTKLLKAVKDAGADAYRISDYLTSARFSP